MTLPDTEVLVTAALGGMLIGLAVVWLLLATGRIAGISGITGKVLAQWPWSGGGQWWPLLFLLGLGVGGWLALPLSGYVPAEVLRSAQIPVLVLAGVLVGVGTRMGSGCTSGHGVCGSARLSVRSLVATGVFLVVGMLVATSLGWLL